jgi:hypothetical protein
MFLSVLAIPSSTVVYVFEANLRQEIGITEFQRYEGGLWAIEGCKAEIESCGYWKHWRGSLAFFSGVANLI